MPDTGPRIEEHGVEPVGRGPVTGRDGLSRARMKAGVQSRPGVLHPGERRLGVRQPVRRVGAVDSPTTKCSRRISAQCSTSITTPS